MNFRDLTLGEIEEFKQWARENYVKGDEINPTWHPVVREECLKINGVTCDDCIHHSIIYCCDEFKEYVNVLCKEYIISSDPMSVTFEKHEISFYDGWNQYPSIELNYCPYCGKKNIFMENK